MVQKRRFQKEINAKNMEKSSVKLNKSSNIYNLHPFMDADGLIRVGGRLKHSHLDSSCKHPVLLPKQEKVIDLVLKWYGVMASALMVEEMLHWMNWEDQDTGW